MGTEKEKETAICYVRVSTAQQVEGVSLDAQTRTLTAIVEAAGYIPLVIEEPGISGKNITSRPGLLRALDMLKRGEASALYVTKIDRLSRSTIDVLSISEKAAKQEWRLVALDLNLDTGTPVGKLILTVLAATSELERARIGQRHEEWHKEKAAQGIIWGRDEGPRSTLPEEVRSRILTMRKDGFTFRQIASTLTEEGIPTVKGGKWYASTVSRVVKSPLSAA